MKEIKGAVLAGGKGTRLMPLTKIINKNILAVYNKPLIYYPIFTLRDAGIKEILIISGRGHAGQYLDLLSDGKDLGVKLTYVIQEEPKGLAHGLSMAEDFADNGPIIMILGDNIYEENLKKAVDDFKKQIKKEGKGAKVILKQVPDPERFGVPEFKGDKIVKIVEKPKKPKTDWIVTGFYMCDARAFDFIRTLKPSARKELEITDLLNCYVKEESLTYHKIKDEWIDAGTFDSLLKANMFIAKKLGKI
jgi:glucose-1-phosphate thymidylyltransferase